MSRLVDPHGGTLVDRFVPADEVEGLRHRAESLPQITLDAQLPRVYGLLYVTDAVERI